MKNDNNLFYTCSLTEYIARKTKNNRYDVINQLGTDLRCIYDYADVIEGMKVVYQSWLADRILNFNSDLFYQPREYIANSSFDKWKHRRTIK